MLLLLFSIPSCSAEREQPLRVRDGVLTLLQESLVSPRAVYGSWEVHVGYAYNPETFDAGRIPERYRYQQVPPPGGRYYTPAGERLVTGMITYRLRIDGVPAEPPIALEVPLVYGSVHAWVNSVMVTSLGSGAESDDHGWADRFAETRIRTSILVPVVPGPDGIADVVLCVGSAIYPFGGMTLLPPRIGTLQALQQARMARAFRDGLLVGLALLIGAYHVLLVFSPNRDIPNLFLALLALVVAFRFSLAGGEMILTMLLNLPVSAALRLQGLSFYLMVPFYVLFLRRFFPLAATRMVFRLVERVSWIWLGASLIVPLTWWMDVLFGYFPIIVAAFWATGVTLGRALRTRQTEACLIAVGFAIFVVAAILDLLRLAGFVSIGVFLMLPAATMFLVMNSLAVSRRMVDFRIALSNLREQAQRDGLTGLFNRRTLDMRLHEEWNRHMRSAQPLALVMVDVDFFKKYNDTRGHQAGDEALRIVARILEENAQRMGDVAARYGGEEFVIILPNTDITGAYKLAGVICRAIQAEAIPHPTTPDGVLTASIGVTTTVPGHNHKDPADPACLLRAADRALYDAKSGGRNTVRTGIVTV